MNRTVETAARIRKAGIIAIIRGNYPVSRVVQIADALLHTGVTVMEITLNSKDALQAVAALQEHMQGQMCIGAGTVRTAEHVDAAIAAGAEFLVAPVFDSTAATRSQSYDLLYLPGVFTPTEAEQAFRAGCRLLKLFPADAFGPGYVKALLAPLDDLALVPTGGITVENVATYRRAGAVAVGIGSALVRDPGQSVTDIHARAMALRQEWEWGRRD